MDIRPATSTDLPDIVRMLADDPLGAQRERFEDPLPPAYSDAFDAIVRQHGNQILVAVEPGAGGNDLVIGCLQLTFIPGLARLGTTRAQIDGVRVDARHRGKSIGESPAPRSQLSDRLFQDPSAHFSHTSGTRLPTSGLPTRLALT